MNNYKIKVNNESESKEAQELFFELGYAIGVVSYKQFPVLVIAHNCGYGPVSTTAIYMNHEHHKDYKELTFPQLRDLVVLQRNDVNDANYTYSGKPVLKLETQDYKVWDSESNTWTEYIGSQTDLRKGIKRIQSEQGLISGVDALRALADGKEVELRDKENNWVRANNHHLVGLFLGNAFDFRLKPRTITLNVEIPAPFEPKEGEKAYRLAPAIPRGYTEFYFGEDENESQFGAWRTEEEIKQVVADLRGGIKG